jgi:y4mF family transcriptional regulator
VRKARKSLKLTQEQLAFAEGVGSRFIVDLEAGKSTLTLEPALRVVDALGAILHLVGMPDEDEAKHAS